jgi:hypothetical protein
MTRPFISMSSKKKGKMCLTDFARVYGGKKCPIIGIKELARRRGVD